MRISKMFVSTLPRLTAIVLAMLASLALATNVFVDRAGRPTRKIVTLDPNHADFLELNGNDIAAPGARVGIIPCIKALRGSPSSLVVPTFEMYINFTQQTLLLSNVGDPHVGDPHVGDPH